MDREKLHRLLRLGIEKGASNPLTDHAGTLNRQQVREIAELKFKDLNALDIEGAMRQIEGTARQMGVHIVD